MARVIPPLTGASPTITPAMLTATNVPETAPAAYNAGTNYAVDAQCSRPNSGSDNALDVYVSLVTPNTGNTPESSPTQWRFLGTTYPEWVAGTYAANDRVIVAADHLEYLSLVGSNTAALTDTTKWQLQGYTNRWRAFDLIRNTGATGPSPMTFTITPGQRISAVGMAGVIADSFTIEVRVGGILKWTHTEGLSSRVTLLWSDYFFGGFTFREVSAVFDIPKYAGAEVTITFERASGDITVGALWPGNDVYFGELEVDPQLGQRNSSRFDEAEDGTLTLIQKQTKPEQSWVVYCPKPQLPRVIPLIEKLNAVPGLWTGLTDASDEYFGPTVLVAVYTRMDLTLSHPDVRIDLTLLATSGSAQIA